MAEHHSGPRSTAFALVYASVLPHLREVAREHGYSLAVHGSMQRDLDLVAIPWVEEASSAFDLAEALRVSVNGVFCDPARHGANPCWKPHGRLAWSFYMRPEGGPPYIDLSVVARRREGEHYENEATERIDAAIRERTPAVGKELLCLVCAYEKPWGIYDPKTGAAVCAECRDKAQAKEKRIDLVESVDGEWAGLYVDYQLFHQGHQIPEHVLIKAMGIPVRKRFVDSAWVEEQGDLPLHFWDIPTGKLG